MTKLMPPSVSVTRFARLSALLVVCCSIWPAASSALTQEEISQAIIDAIPYFGSEDGYIYTVPFSNDDMNYLSDLLTANLNVHDPSSGVPPLRGTYSVSQLESVSAARLHSIYYWLRSVLPIVTNRLDSSSADVSSILDYLVDYDLGGWLQEIAEDTGYIEDHSSSLVDLLERQHFTGDELRVFDSRVETAINSLSRSIGSVTNAIFDSTEEDDDYQIMTNGLADLKDSVVQIYDFLTTVQLDYSNYWSREPSSSYPEIDTEISEEYHDAAGYFDDMELPEATVDDDPQPSGQILDEGWLELGRVDVYEDHNALIRLVDAPSRSSTGPIPTIEIDLGSDSALDLGMRNFASWVQWLAGVLFGFLLSVKGLGMWRVVRTASVAAQAGTDPFIHLAWNPF